MRLMKLIRKPEYLWQPKRAWMKFRMLVTGAFMPELTKVRLPWGHILEVDSQESIGRSIADMGVHELAVAEVLWRLTDRDEVAVDVGANIGFMTSLLAWRVGQNGTVYSYEPHPQLFDKLRNNISRWLNVNVIINQLAISSTAGEGILRVPIEFDLNQGIASLNTSQVMTASSDYTDIQIYMKTLDSLFAGLNIDVLKVDVEGHELDVFNGSIDILRESRVRDIVFEEHEDYPTEVTELLKKYNYTIYKIDKGILKPIIRRAKKGLSSLSFGAPSYLATLNPERAEKRLCEKGWRCLGG